MDALEFINERDRMCAASKDCHACFANRKGCIFNYPANNTAKEQVKVLEEWSATHPRETRQSKFLEQYPDAKIKSNGVLDIKPCIVEKSMVCWMCCTECHEHFWLQEVK